MNATIHVASILAVALSAIPASAQGYMWSQLTPVNSPSVRDNHALAYDAARQRVVLFGGSHSNLLLGDTWEWDGTTWLQHPPATSPLARSRHRMAYDSQRGKTVLFGGSGASGIVGDTWEWDGTNWMQSAPLASPSARFGHAMAYDSVRQRVVLFGGFGASVGQLGDTWEWDGTSWTQVATTGPAVRYGHAMAYDSQRGVTVMFGGGSNSPYLSDTWEWDGTTWSPRFSANYPSARTYHAMAYDADRQRVVLFGGRGPGPGVGSYLSDTWEWDGTNWAQWAPTTSAPARAFHALAFYAAGQSVVLFGGSLVGAPCSFYCFFNDTWIDSPSTAPASATAYGAGCGSPALGFVPDANGQPLLGQVGSATIVDAPTPVAAVAIGWSNQFFGGFALPVTLAGIGMPGCNLLQSADIIGLAVSPVTPTTLSFSLGIPNVPSLLGSHVYMQAYAFAPGENPLQIIISNGIDWLLGNV